MAARGRPKKVKDAEPRTEAEILMDLGHTLADRPVGIDSQALLTSLIRIWGGPEKLALSFFQEFGAAPHGGATRQRILEMIQRLVITNTESERSGVRNPSDMTNEELEVFAKSYMLRVIDGKAQGNGAVAAQQTPAG